MRSNIFSTRQKKANEITRMPRILLYESEAMRIARYTQSSSRIEIGGDFFGFYEPGGSPLVFVASGPGPKARRDVTHFQQDTEFQTRVFNQLASQFRMFYLGDWHSHHNLGLSEPSGSDDAKLEDLAHMNGWPQLSSLIVQTEGGHGKFGGNYRGSISAPDVLSGPIGAFGIWWNAFHYVFSEQGASRQRVQIDFQPGDSPFRATADAINVPGSVARESHSYESPNFINDQMARPVIPAPRTTDGPLDEFIVDLYQKICNALSSELRDAAMEVDLEHSGGPRLIVIDKGKLVVCRVSSTGNASLQIAINSRSGEEVGLTVAYARGIVRAGDVKAIAKRIKGQL